MKSIHALVLAGMASVLAGCSAWRWSGHPKQVAEPSGLPGRVTPGDHRSRTHGVGLHSPEGRSPVYNIPDKPGPHTVNALLYAQKADQFRQEAANHDAMKRLYAGDAEMTAHCDALIKQLTALADEYQAISKLHEKRAEAVNEPLLKELRK